MCVKFRNSIPRANGSKIKFHISKYPNVNNIKFHIGHSPEINLYDSIFSLYCREYAELQLEGDKKWRKCLRKNNKRNLEISLRLSFKWFSETTFRPRCVCWNSKQSSASDQVGKDLVFRSSLKGTVPLTIIIFCFRQILLV